jgi:hypothetical protein
VTGIAESNPYSPIADVLIAASDAIHSPSAVPSVTTGQTVSKRSRRRRFGLRAHQHRHGGSRLGLRRRLRDDLVGHGVFRGDRPDRPYSPDRPE